MIEFKSGNILEEEADALVNTVNCVGIMGRGIALEFKRAFPTNYKAYEAACIRHEVEPGRMFVFETGTLTEPRFIINFPTKRHWRGKSRLADIDSGLQDLTHVIDAKGIRSIAIPPLGSGLGGLRWTDVRPKIVKAMEALPGVRVIVYEPYSPKADSTPVRAPKVPTMTRSRAILVGLIQQYLTGLLSPFVTLLEVHKLVYFMQEADEPLRLQFAKGPYGPYAENLRHVLQAIDGYYISGYGAGGDSPNKPIELVPGAVEDAEQSLNRNAGLRKRFDRVAELVDGFESPFGLELLATVHWVLTRETRSSENDLVARVYAWADRKRQFSPAQIELARDVLASHGWLNN